MTKKDIITSLKHLVITGLWSKENYEAADHEILSA